MASGDGVTIGKLASILRNQRREMGLGGTSSPEAQSQFYQFIGTLLQYIKGPWNSDDGWKNGEIPQHISFGEVKFNELQAGETGNPEELVQALAEILKEERDTVAHLFPRADLEILDAQREELERVSSPSKAEDILERYLKALAPAEEEEEHSVPEFPATVRNRLESEREAALTEENAFDALLLRSLGEKLQNETQTQQRAKQEESAFGLWSDEKEEHLQTLLQRSEEYNKWVELLQRERREAINNHVINRALLIDREKIGSRYLPIFTEHTKETGYSSAQLDESAVVKAAEAYWAEIYELIVRAQKITSPDQTFERGVFERTVFDTYLELARELKKLTGKHEAGAQIIASRLQQALGQTATDVAPAISPDGGGDEQSSEAEEAESQTAPPQSPSADEQTSPWQRRRNDALESLLELQRFSESGDVLSQRREELVGIVNSLANAMDQYWGIAGDAATLNDVFEALRAFDFEAWTNEQITAGHPEVIENAFATLERILTAASELLQTENQVVSPGEAAARALAAQEEAQQAAGEQPPVPGTTGSKPTTAQEAIDQLKDLGKLTHAQATLTELTMQILEDELRQNTVFSEEQIQTFLQQNREAVSQAVWTNYLQTLTGKAGIGDLNAAMMARIAISSSGLFVEKMNLETFGSTSPITGSGASRGFSGSLPPGILEKLTQIATENGYESPDELVSALFGQNLTREQALFQFIKLAQHSASFNETKISAFSRLLIDQLITPAQRAAGSDVERWLARLNDDQAGFDAFFVRLPDERSQIREYKRQWLILQRLLKQAEGRALTPQERQEAERILRELAPLLLMYETYGDSFYALRFGTQDLNRFSAALSEYRQYEEHLARTTPPPSVSGLPSGTAEYQYTIPAAFSSVTFTRLQQPVPAGISTRTHIPLFLAISGNDLDKQMRLATHLERRNNRASNRINLAQWQRATASSWTDDMYRSAGGGQGQKMRSAARLAAKAKKGQLLNTLLKNKAVVRALISAATTAAGAVFSAVAAILPWLPLIAGVYVIAHSLVGVVQSVGTFLGNVFTGVGNFLSGIFGGGNAAIPFAKASSAQVASSASIKFNNWLKANSQGAVQSANATGQIANSIIQSTTMANVSASIVMAGILMPLALTATLTIIVWMVIANSFNDYGVGQGIARRRSAPGCWPTTGTITVMRTYADGTPHNTTNTATVQDFGTAIDISGERLEEIYSPFGGTATAYAEGEGGPGNDPYGNFVRLTTTQGFDIIFAHMHAMALPSGEHVIQPGQLIGYMGKTGGDFGVHLHYELLDFSGGMEIFDVTPVPESSIRLGMRVSAFECAGLFEEATPSAELEPTDPPTTTP